MDSNELPSEITAHYETGVETERLFSGVGKLEMERTKEIILRYLPPPPAVVLDVGGGMGAHALWLAGRQYEVHLIDPVPLHIEEARRASIQQRYPLASVTLGDARSLDRPNSSVDVALFLGPMYHLTDRVDRQNALSEASRTLRSGGVIFVAAISRFASLLDGMWRGFIDDPEFEQITRRDLKTGQHRNPSGHLHYFTTAFFHHPDELRQEMSDVGFTKIEILAVEGFAWLLSDFNARWNDARRRAQLLDLIRMVEKQPSLMGMSAHLLGIGVGQ